jgi:alkylation response protein AidB-like acyl-CoA dehydrogenase
MAVHSFGLDPSLSNRLREVVRDHIAPHAEAVDREARWPAESMQALLEAGFGGLLAPEDVGGLGHGLLGLMQACEIIGGACTSTALCFGMHCVGTAVIAAKATDYQRAEYLLPIARGEHITTLALSERGSGSHLYYPLTELHTSPSGGYVLRGSKSFITSGGFANSYVVSAVDVNDERTIGEFSCVVLKEGTPGMKWDPPWKGLGMRGNASRGVELDDVDVPEEDLLGAKGDQIWYIFHVVAPVFLSAMAGTYLGVADAAFGEARRHILQRGYDYTGRRLADMTVLQHRLGELWATVERTRRLVYFAGSEGDRAGEHALTALCAAKADVADCAVHVVNEAMTMMGGIAYAENGRLGRLLRDARASHIMAPTTDVLRVWTGRALLGLPLLSE